MVGRFVLLCALCFFLSRRLDSPNVPKKKSVSIFSHPPLRFLYAPSPSGGDSAFDSFIRLPENGSKGVARKKTTDSRNYRTGLKIKMNFFAGRDQFTERRQVFSNMANYLNIFLSVREGKKKRFLHIFLSVHVTAGMFMTSNGTVEVSWSMDAKKGQRNGKRNLKDVGRSSRFQGQTFKGRQRWHERIAKQPKPTCGEGDFGCLAAKKQRV